MPVQELPRVPVPQMTGLGQTGPYMQVSDPVSDYASKALGVQPQGDLRHLWQMVTQVGIGSISINRRESSPCSARKDMIVCGT